MHLMIQNMMHLIKVQKFLIFNCIITVKEIYVNWQYSDVITNVKCY